MATLMHKCFAATWGASLFVTAFAAEKPAPTYSLPDLTATVVDGRTGQGLAYAVVQASWTARPAAGKPTRTIAPGKRLLSRQVHSKPGGQVMISAVRPLAVPAGWVLASGQDPVVRVYNEGYRRLVVFNTVATKDGRPVSAASAAAASERTWSAQGATLALKPLSKEPTALKKELALWKNDLETEIAAYAQQDRSEAIRSQEKLLFLFDKVCKTLPQLSRAGLCYEPTSELGRYLTAALVERGKFLTIENDNGEIAKVPVVVSSPPASVMRAGVPIPEGTSAEKLKEAFEQEVRSNMPGSTRR